jgi:hypothetical protein
MPAEILNFIDFAQYYSNLIQKANHHAGKVRLSIPLILDWVLLNCDISSARYKIYNGEIKNVIWIRNKTKDQKLVFTYNHKEQFIEVRTGKLTSPIIMKIDNATQLLDLDKINQ